MSKEDEKNANDDCHLIRTLFFLSFLLETAEQLLRVWKRLFCEGATETDDGDAEYDNEEGKPLMSEEPALEEENAENTDEEN